MFLFLAFLWAAPSYLFLKKNKSRWLVGTIQNKNVTQGMDPNTDTINTMNTMGPWAMNIKGRTGGKWMISG